MHRQGTTARPGWTPWLQGFSATLNAILDNVPAGRQTLLFSATQTKSVKVCRMHSPFTQHCMGPTRHCAHLAWMRSLACAVGVGLWAVPLGEEGFHCRTWRA